MLQKKTTYFLTSSFLGLVAITIFSYNNLNKLQENSTEVQNSYQIQDQTDALIRDLTTAESGQRGYLLTKEYKNTLYLSKYNSAVERIPQRLNALGNLLSNSPDQNKRLKEIKPLIAAKLNEIKRTIALSQIKKNNEAISIVLTDKGENLMNAIILQANNIKTTENYLLQHHSQALIVQEQQTLFILFAGRVIAFILVAISVFALDEEIIKRKSNEEKLVEMYANSEKKVEERTEQYKEASRAKDEFLTVLSHELRSPLTAILGWTKLIKSGNLSQIKLKEGVDTIERNAKSQAKLVDDILDISRIIQGKLRLSVRQVELAEAVASAIESIKPAADSKSIRIQTIFDSSISPVLADPDRLHQIFWNLLSNAVKFTSKRGIVQVRLERINSHIEVSVRDNGIGIDPIFLPHVFDRFLQYSEGTTRTDGGLGLGLAIAKQLVDLHGGTITASSEGKGQGATFSVVLPLMAANSTVEVERINPHQEKSDNPFQDSQDLAGFKILVVDDDTDTRSLLSTILQCSGADVLCASNANDALAVIDERDILISDIGMPDVDGYMLIRQVRQRSRIKAIALTAYARTEDRINALNAGFNAFLAKPIDPTELVTVIVNLLKN